MARLRLLVTPGARVDEIVRTVQGELRVRVAAPAVEGKANRRLCRYLAAVLNVAPSRVTVVQGAGSRYKTVEVTGLVADDLHGRIRSALGSAEDAS